MTWTDILARSEHRARAAASTDSWYRIDAQANRSAKVYVYDVISWFGVDAQQFVKDLHALEVDEIELHINSPGGAAFDGIAIRNALIQHDANVTAIVDGLAASAASIIALAGDRVVMAEGSQMMIHDASGLAIGNAQDMRDYAAVLDKVSGSLAEMYAKRAGGTSTEWRDRMRAETWYTAQEAVDAKLADEVQGTAVEDVAAKFDLSIFTYAGRDNAPAPAAVMAAHMPPAEPEEQEHPNEEGADMASDQFVSGLRERLGVDAEIDEDGLLTALDEALAERTEDHTPPEGTVVIDQAAYDDLQAAAQEGREARKRQIAEDRDKAVAAAVNDGRIPPARKDHWLAQLAADPGAREVLDSLPKNTIPLEPNGYTGGVDESSDEDRVYSKFWGDDEKKGA